MDKRKPSLALVGIGYWGKNLARNFHALGALHTICDVNESLLDQYQSHYPEVEMTSNFRAVLENKEIGQVVVATRANFHYQLSKEALLAGKDVYVEKPLCLDHTEGEELIQIAKEKGRIFMVGHLLQYHPYVVRLKELVAQGQIGKLQYITSNRLNLGIITKEEGSLWAFAPHDISIILSLTGNKLPNQVRSVGGSYLSKGVDDTSLTSMRFEDNVRAHIFVSWLNPFKERKLTVTGSLGILVFDDMRPWGEKLALYRNHVVWQGGNTPVANPCEPEYILVPEAEPLRVECEHFLTCVETRKTPRTDGEEGLRVLKVLESAQLSLNEEGEEHDPREFFLGNLKEKKYVAHPTAVIDEGAVIGEGTHIWHFSHIMKGARVGANCNLGQNVVVSPHSSLGDHVKVQNNVSIYSGVVCENHVFIGPSAVFTNVSNPRAEVSRRDKFERTHVRQGATIGANATIVCGLKLGEYCFVAAGSVITRDVKPYALMIGSPAKHVGWMSRYGEKLDLPLSHEGEEPLMAVCPATGEEYELMKEKLTLKVKTKGKKKDLLPRKVLS